jgi:hypothetical protein
VFDPDLFPESYKENSNKEKLILKYAENFQKQYVHLFRDRKPLFMNPVNECGCEVSENLCNDTFFMWKTSTHVAINLF